MKHSCSFLCSRLLPVLMLLHCVFLLPAQELFKGYEHLFTTPKHYTIYQAADSIVIDGRPSENAWQQAAWSDYFVDIEGDRQPAPPLKTRLKMLWDQHALYIYTEMEEPHIWAMLKEHDQIIYHDNDFELFIDPAGTTHNYFEFEINAFGTTMDLFMAKPYREGQHPLMRWSPHNVRSAVFIDGTLNNPDDTDKMWSVEMAIPFEAVSMGGRPQAPAHGTQWRINFSRVERDTEIVNHAYKKKTEPGTGRMVPEHNWVWSPQGIINMHYPERWGYAVFSTSRVGTSHEKFELPPSEELKKYLWLMYYKQAAYKNRHKRYALNIDELGFPKGVMTINGQRCMLSIDATARQYIATIRNMDSGEKWELTNEGYVGD